MASSTTTANVGVGHKVGFYNVTGTNNTYLGYQAGIGASGQSHSNNVAIGSNLFCESESSSDVIKT